MVLKGGGRGAYGRSYSRSLFYDVRTHGIEYSMAHNESLKLLSTISLSTIVTYPFLIIDLSKLFSRVFFASTSETAASDSVESMDWPAAILDSQCRWTLGESLTHTQSDDRRNLDLDIEGLVSNKIR